MLTICYSLCEVRNVCTDKCLQGIYFECKDERLADKDLLNTVVVLGLYFFRHLEKFQSCSNIFRIL